MASDHSIPKLGEPAHPSAWRRAVVFLRRLLFGSRRRVSIDPLLEVLPEFDIEKILAEMRIREKAVENGRHEIPGTSDVRLDGHEALIVQHVEQAVREGKSLLQTHLANLSLRIDSCDVSQECRALRDLPEGLRRQLEGFLEHHAEHAAPTRERFRALRAELRDFRERFGIRYAPHAPAPHWLHVGVLLLILVAESLLNGRYLAKADELGYLGGVTNAFVIALVNVLTSFFLGRGAACVGGARPRFRALGAVAATVFLVWVSGYNLAIAHYRDLLGSPSSGGAYAALVQSLGERLATPFRFEDVGSWLLLALGVVFSLVSFFDGIRWDDSTPGYTKLARRVDEAREDYLHERQQLDSNARNHYVRRVADLHERADRVRYRVDSLRNDVHQKSLLVAKAENFFRYAQSACNAMLAIYRDLNRQNRKTAPPPYFQEPWAHAEPELVEFDLAPDQVRLDTQVLLLRDLVERRETIARDLDGVHAEFGARARQLRDLDGDAPDEPAWSAVA